MSKYSGDDSLFPPPKRTKVESINELSSRIRSRGIRLFPPCIMCSRNNSACFYSRDSVRCASCIHLQRRCSATATIRGITQSDDPLQLIDMRTLAAELQEKHAVYLEVAGRFIDACHSLTTTVLSGESVPLNSLYSTASTVPSVPTEPTGPVSSVERNPSRTTQDSSSLTSSTTRASNASSSFASSIPGSLFHGDFDAASNLVSSDPSFNNVRDLGLEQYLSSSPNRVVASTNP